MGISLGDAEGAAGLRNVAAGFLLNFLINQTALQKKVDGYLYNFYNIFDLFIYVEAIIDFVITE